MSTMRIHAVEGSNLVSVVGCEKLVKIFQAQKEKHQVFVIAPLRDTPLELGSLLAYARKHDERLWSELERCSSLWTTLAESLLTPIAGEEVLIKIREGFSDMEDLLRAVWLVEDISVGSQAFIDTMLTSWVAELCCHYFASQGISSSMLDFTAAMKKTSFDTQALFVYGTLPQAEKSEPREGISEYGAALLGATVGAQEVTFWNSLSLLRNADLADVPSALVIPYLSFSEATELSFFGAPIIHPQALLPAMNASIDVQLRWWGDLRSKGSIISSKSTNGSSNKVKGFSTIREVALINVEGAGMSGVVGIAGRLFSAMRRASISVILISQASSEYSICFAVPEGQKDLACLTAQEAFAHEIADGLIHSVTSEGNCAILAAVGEQMTGQAGVSGKFFSSLGKAGVNVIAIAQGSSETNISAVIKEKDCKKALRALHARFFLSKQALSVGLFGPGSIGGTLLDQLASEAVRLKEQFGLDIHIRGIANSTMMILRQDGVDLANWREELTIDAVPLDIDRFAKHIGATYFPHSLIVDCTTSSHLAQQYVTWLEQGIHVITPNKKAGTEPYAYYQSIFDTCLRTGRRFLYETTVGAGLPVICTLKDLIQTGDRIHRIEGIVSGTLAWLFNEYDASVPFSTLVRQAKEMGFTEPDPRDDLSGMDVGRKSVILARELGYKVEVQDIPIQSLVPAHLQDIRVEEFLERLEELDGPVQEMYAKASAKGEKLRYVGMVDQEGNCSASLMSFPESHAFAQATGTDNVICFTTDRYLEQPLVIKGPGAGRAVTAGGVFSDILRLAAYLGARI